MIYINIKNKKKLFLFFYSKLQLLYLLFLYKKSTSNYGIYDWK